jgi:outer membrane receptor protein involved in Fe transport
MLLPAFTLNGQEEDEEDEVFVLSPFVVETAENLGYAATNSTSGTRLAVPIRDLPMSLDVLTSELMTDQGATDFKSAVAYSAGLFTNSSQFAAGSGANASSSAEVSPSSQAGVGNFRNNAISIRGFNTAFQLRNGFRIGGFIPSAGINLGGLTDAISVDRIEVVKGPQSLLYGLSVLSGIANIIPKTPLDTHRFSAKTTAGSYGLARFEMDSTGPLGENFSYRAFAAIEKEGYELDFRESSLRYYGFQLQKYLLDRRLKLFGELQYGTQREEGIGATSVRDSYTQSIDTNVWNFKNEYGEFVDWHRDPNFGNKENDRSFNIGGPDPYFDREELNLVVDMEVKPLKEHDFWLKAGVMYGEQDIEERALQISSPSNRGGFFAYFDALRIPGTYNDIYNNPGVVTILRNPDPTLGSSIFPAEQAYPGVLVNASEVPRSSLVDTDDYKAIRYNWTEIPTVAKNLQIRTELTYILQTSGILGNARHSFLLGRLDLEDKVDYVSRSFQAGTPALNWGLEPGYFDPPFHTNPGQRKNIFDLSPIHYQGEPYAETGESRRIEATFTGHYFAYNGTWFGDRLNVILGVRRDEYQAWEGLYDRVGWLNPDVTLPSNPTQEDLLNRINPAWDPFNPNETVGRATPLGGFNGFSFEEDQVEHTKMGATSYRINDSWSVYGLYGEGISPNTGLKDGLWDAIEAERTESNEIGVKFDLMGGKVSGGIAIWRIKRSNVIWASDFAPFPGVWIDGKYTEERALAGPPINPESLFDPNFRSDDPGNEYPNDPELSYWVEASFLDEVGAPYVRQPNFETKTFEYPEGVIDVQSNSAGGLGYIYVLVEPSRIPNGSMLEQALENAFNADFILPDGVRYGANARAPILWDHGAGRAGNNPSMNIGQSVNVTFEDESRGIDLNFLITPVPNWQIVLNYSYIKREVTSPFNLAPVTHPETGENLGTPYDRWVYFLGRDAFEDPSDPTTLTTGIKGLSLFFSPNHSGAIWNKYVFDDGPLDGLELGIGAIYNSESPTSIPIGGRDALLNPYRTPPIPERLKFDALLAYSWDWLDARWRLQMNIYNLTNDTLGRSIVNYETPEGENIKRRTVRFYAPTTFRCSLGVSF